MDSEMVLKEVYSPIKDEMEDVSSFIRSSLESSEARSIADISRFLLESPGKRIRPALVILSARSVRSRVPCGKITKIASAVELVHMASLLHDDVIDHSRYRHSRPTVNSIWGRGVAITLGDYLYSVAFEIISDCGSVDVAGCISGAAKNMCEGELIQVCERENLDLLKERYIVIIKKKTASLFAASCQTGALISESPKLLYGALKEYGTNFGIAFQIVDDYLDLVGEEESLGKEPGQDIGVGEMTLPMLNLLGSVRENERKELKRLLASRRDKEGLREIRSMFFNSDAAVKTKKTVSSYIALAQDRLNVLTPSAYKKSLISLADFIIERGFDGDP